MFDTSSFFPSVFPAWFHLRDAGKEDSCDNDYLDDLKERIDMSFEDEDDPSHSDEEDESSADEDDGDE